MVCASWRNRVPHLEFAFRGPVPSNLRSSVEFVSTKVARPAALDYLSSTMQDRCH